MKAGLSDSEIKEVLKLSTSKEIKDKLKSATQAALDHGASFPSDLLVDSGKRDKKLPCNEQNLSCCFFSGVWLPHGGVSRRWEAGDVFWI